MFMVHLPTKFQTPTSRVTAIKSKVKYVNVYAAAIFFYII